MEQNTSNKKLTPKQIGIGCGILVAFVILLTVALSTCGGPDQSSSSQTVDLAAAVRFDGAQFHIANNNSFDWYDVELDLNPPGVFSSGYLLEISRITAGSTYSIGALQFAKSDGTRFNPFTTKPVKISISAETADGQRGFWSGGW